MGRAPRRYGGDERCIKGFGGRNLGQRDDLEKPRRRWHKIFRK